MSDGNVDDAGVAARAAHEAKSQGAQCWICPQCYDDRHHEPGDNYCLKQQKSEAIRIARINQLSGEWVRCDEQLPTKSDATPQGMVRWRRSGVACNGIYSDVPVDADAWQTLPQPPKNNQEDAGDE